HDRWGIQAPCASSAIEHAAQTVLQRTDSSSPAMHDDFRCIFRQERVMKYPVYITRHGNPRYRGALPDFPEIDVAGDSYGELLVAAAQQVMACYDRSARLVPPPTTDMSILQASDVDVGNGIWRFFDIDLTGMTSSSVRIEL